MQREIFAQAMKVSAQSVGGPELLSRLAFVRTLTMSLGKKMRCETSWALRVTEVLLLFRRMFMGIKDCFNIYNTLLNKKYVLHIEGNMQLEITFSKHNLKHLLGLQKLKDINIVTENKAPVVYNLIKKNIVNDKLICGSQYYSKIEERILYFYLIPTILQSKIIVDFDPSKIPDSYKSKLQETDYILYHRIDSTTNAHLTLSEKDEQKHKCYPETFFVEHSQMYLTGQDFKDILNVEIIEL